MDFNKKALIIILLGLSIGIITGLRIPAHVHAHKLPFYCIFMIFSINSFIFSINVFLYSIKFEYLVLFWIFVNTLFESFIAFSVIEIISVETGMTTVFLIIAEMSVLTIFCKFGFKSKSFIIGEILNLILAVLEVIAYRITA